VTESAGEADEAFCAPDCARRILHRATFKSAQVGGWEDACAAGNRHASTTASSSGHRDVCCLPWMLRRHARIALHDSVNHSLLAGAIGRGRRLQLRRRRVCAALSQTG
jgi:hypothetical protein